MLRRMRQVLFSGEQEAAGCCQFKVAKRKNCDKVKKRTQLAKTIYFDKLRKQKVAKRVRSAVDIKRAYTDWIPNNV